METSIVNACDFGMITESRVNRITPYLCEGIYPNEDSFIPHQHIMNNIANVYIGVKFSMHENQDVVIMLIDIEKAFDII